MCQNPSPGSTPSPNPSSRNWEEAGEEEVEERRERWPPDAEKQALVHGLSRRLSYGDANARIDAAREIRRRARASSSARSLLADVSVIEPLVTMLSSSEPASREASLLALLNLAVRNQRNKNKIVESGAVPHLVELLQSGNCSELATAAILTLSGSDSNKPALAASGAVPLLVQILASGSIQGKADAVTVLYNLSTSEEVTDLAISVEAIGPLLSLLKDCKKYSKFAEKATALLEILMESEEARCSVLVADSGILTLVETVEDGSLLSAEHSVQVLLSLCRSCSRYKELVLNEGPIPGLLVLAVEGTEKARGGACNLLHLLREDLHLRRATSSNLEAISYDVNARVNDSPDGATTV